MNTMFVKRSRHPVFDEYDRSDRRASTNKRGPCSMVHSTCGCAPGETWIYLRQRPGISTCFIRPSCCKPDTRDVTLSFLNPDSVKQHRQNDIYTLYYSVSMSSLPHFNFENQKPRNGSDVQNYPKRENG